MASGSLSEPLPWLQSNAAASSTATTPSKSGTTVQTPPGVVNRKGQGQRRQGPAGSQALRSGRPEPHAYGPSGRGGAAADGGWHECTVDDLCRIVKGLPFSASAITAVMPGLAYQDGRALAALLKALAKCGLGARAVEIFDHLRNVDPKQGLASLCDVFSYTTMISQCGSHHQLRRALELVAEMRGRGVSLNVHTYSALLNVCLKSNELELAADIYEQMLASGVTPNLVTYNTLLEVYAKAGKWAEALAVLDTLRSRAISPEVRTFNAAMSACNAAGRHAEALSVLAALHGAGLEPSAATYAAAITAHARRGSLDGALSLFKAMAVRGLERSAAVYAAVLDACQAAARWDTALELLGQMHCEGLRPSASCLLSAINTCLAGGQTQHADRLLERLQAVAHPDASVHSGLVRALSSAGKWRNAAVVVETMARAGQAPEAASYGALVEALWGSGVLAQQCYALALFERARAQGMFGVLVQQDVAEGTLSVQLPATSRHVRILLLMALLQELRHLVAAQGPSFLLNRVLLRFSTEDTEHAAMHQLLAGVLAAWGAPFAACDTAVHDAAPSQAPSSFNLLPTLPLSPGNPPTRTASGGSVPARTASGSSATTRTGSGISAAAVGDAVATSELRFAADAASAAQWLVGPQLGAALDVLSLLGSGSATHVQLQLQPGCEATAVCEEDARREAVSRQALTTIQRCELVGQIDIQAISDLMLLQRPDLISQLLATCSHLGLSPETGHDAALLLDRAAASPALVVADPAVPRLLAAGCLCLAAHAQLGGGGDAATAVAGALQLAPAAVLGAVVLLQRALGGQAAGTVAISALRVLEVYLERLGCDVSGNPAATPSPPCAAHVAAGALPLMGRALLSASFIGCPPSTLAAVVLYVSRLVAGLTPAWPGALAELTGLAVPTPALQPYVQAALSLLLHG